MKYINYISQEDLINPTCLKTGGVLGIPWFYPSSTRNPFYYQQSDHPADDTYLGGKDDINFGSGEEFSIHINGPTSFFVQRDPSFTDSIGGCRMDFAASEQRGYTHKSNDLRDVEYKCLIKITGGDGQNSCSISGPTGHHTSSNCCQGFSYMFNFSYTDNTPQFRFRKEMWHVSYHDNPIGYFSDPRVNFKIQGHGYIGIGYVRYNKKDGRSAGHDSVILEGWFNPNPTADINNWFMIKRIEDKGGWGNDGDDCPGGVKDQVGTWGGEHFRIKSNDSSADFTIKHLSLREIDPNGSFDDNPSEPPPPPTPIPGGTTTIVGTFKFQQDINTSRGQSSCAGTTSGEPGGGGGGGGGSGTGLAKFWTIPANHDKELSDSSTFQHRTRIGERIKSSSSSLKGKLPTQVDVPLKKVGSPGTTPHIHCKIWNSSDNTVYESPTIIDPTTLTTNFVYKTFEFSTNTHILVVGDTIGVEWTGTSDSNYIEAGYEDGAVSTSSVYANYESGSWDEKDSRDWAVDIWES